MQKKHHGNQNHVESPKRIDSILEYIKLHKQNYRNIEFLDECDSKTISHIKKSIINNVINCFYCTFEFSKDDIRCPICNMKNDGENAYKFVSETSGDTTYKTLFTDIIINRVFQMISKGIHYIINPHTNIKEVFIASRPPGHHSCGYNNTNITNPRGFCHTNFIAYAAEEITTKYNKTVAIFDFDAHHGDGTEQCLRDMQNHQIKGFVSTHLFGDNIYPFTGEQSDLSNITPILNIPIHKSIKCTDEYYINILETQVKQFLISVNPDIILVSAGFDAHNEDYLKLMQITEKTYNHIGNMLRSLNKPILYILEGGYNPDMLAKSVSSLLDKN